MLKPKLCLPPLVALAVAGAWLGSQRHSIYSLKEQRLVLQQAIASRKTGISAQSSTGTLSSATKPEKDKEPLDWEKIAASFGEMLRGGGMRDMRGQIKFQQRVSTMSREEIISALDEIAVLDLPEESRELLEQMLIVTLGKKDPESALTQFIDRVQDQQSSISGLLANALHDWAEKDPASASAWFDHQIAAGKFDSKSLDGTSQTRLQFEGYLIDTLISSDPEAAVRRLASLPEDQRKEALQRSPQALKKEDQTAYAKLVRDQLPEKDQSEALARKASSMEDAEGLAKVTEFMDRIKAPPAERSHFVEKTAPSQLGKISNQKKLTRSDLDNMRE